MNTVRLPELFDSVTSINLETWYKLQIKVSDTGFVSRMYIIEGDQKAKIPNSWISQDNHLHQNCTLIVKFPINTVFGKFTIDNLQSIHTQKWMNTNEFSVYVRNDDLAIRFKYAPQHA